MGGSRSRAGGGDWRRLPRILGHRLGLAGSLATRAGQVRPGEWPGRCAARRLGHDRRFIAGVHNTDYFAKSPIKLKKTGYTTLPHNDTTTNLCDRLNRLWTDLHRTNSSAMGSKSIRLGQIQAAITTIELELARRDQSLP